jgi:quercetin 2,3-dioxygenase
MIQVRPAAERGQTRLSWLDGKHSFSFNRYYDPEHMGFRSLRVINDDRVAPGGGFGRHPHEDMEILTWVLEGALAHQDSTGSEGSIRPGDAQKMSAGTGIFHSEVNGSKVEPVHLLQIWIEPAEAGLEPAYEQVHFPLEERKNRLRLIAAPDGRDGAVSMHQDAEVYTGVFETGAKAEHSLKPGRYAWVQMARGAATLNGVELKEGDGAAVSGEQRLVLEASAPAEVLLFDLA